jgi:hypothetical protein
MLKRRKVTVRRATKDDFVRIYGRHPPPVWEAYVGDDGILLVAISGVVQQDNGLWVAFLDVMPGTLRPKQMFSTTKRMLKEMKERDNRTIYALPDPNIRSAGRYMKHLGFFRTKRKAEGRKIWVI